MKVLPHVIGMFLLGLAFLTVFAAVQQRRIHEQTAAASREISSSSGTSKRQARVEALADGIDASLQHAGDLLQSDLSSGVSALDAAKRASEAGGHPFARVHALVLQARHELQNDDASRAKSTIGEAVAALRDVKEPGAKTRPILERYAGATLINARGERIGEVRGIERLDGKTVAEVTIGGVHDAGGFLDFGGRGMRLPREALIFGKPNRIGETLVVWTGQRS